MTPAPLPTVVCDASVLVSALQESLFDVPRVQPVRPWLDHDGLRSIALLYTATEKGNCSGVRFGMSVDDAQTWCSLDVSQGRVYGTAWCYFWTSAAKYCEVFYNDGWPIFDFSTYSDSGDWDERIRAHGLRKYDYDELRELLGPMGVTVRVPRVPLQKPLRSVAVPGSAAHRGRRRTDEA